ncbi:hypothetical protein [Nocardioides sp. AX2bis]|uniref:hypothetical protein n=1 Tax=Nocardioides sp. AX2bis TaxID=2653157 RepID=UPI0012EF8EB3|nr:hypothetical protein [Nocardioides sp. AX2bis]VXB56735.1 membrane hypothetical protein [Nocardioides sp. AX2bis]
MSEVVFTAAAAVLVVGAVLVLVAQHRRAREEHTDPPVEVSGRVRAIQVGLFLAWFVILAVDAVRDGREVGAVVASVGAVVAAVVLVRIHQRKNVPDAWVDPDPHSADK